MQLRVSKKWLAWILTIMLVISSIPLDVLANETISSVNNGEISDQNSDPKIELSQPLLGKTGKREILEQRTENTKVFDNGNGTFTKNIYFEPVHMKENGKWNTLSSRLIATNKMVPGIEEVESIETENTFLGSQFYSRMENGEYALFTQNGHSLTYALVSAEGSAGKIEPNDVEATFSENEILHKEVYPNIDLRNLTFNDKVKEDLVLHSYNGYNNFIFRIKTDLSPVKRDDGIIVFQDANNETILNLPKPFMYDSDFNKESGETQQSNDVTYSIEKETDGSYLLKIQANEEWLTSEERVYPVYIDPTTSIQTDSDAFVASAYPTTNYGASSQKWDPNNNQYVLKTGYYDSTTGTNYAYLKQYFSVVKGAVIDSATLNVYVTHSYYPSTPTGLWLDEVNSTWASTSITWNNKPSSTNIDNVNVARDQWAQFDVTNTVKAWLAGTKNNYGFKLHTNGNG